MKKTVTIQSKRDWTGLLENYEKWQKEIEHWCDGGEVEAKSCNAQWSGGNYCFDTEGVEYRIKQRETKSGEVFICNVSDYWLCINAGEQYSALDGDDTISSDTAIEFGLKYHAPSIEAYYARKLLNDIPDFAGDIIRILKEAAKAGQ